jgi:DNA-binding NtrC family response regulator
MGVKPLIITPKAMKMLEEYSWPGNVRQLKNVVQRMVILANDTEITEDLVDTCMEGTIAIQPEIPEFPEFSAQHILPLKEMDKVFRRKYIEFVRRHSRTDMESAKKLGMAPSNFYRMCKELGIKE